MSKLNRDVDEKYLDYLQEKNTSKIMMAIEEQKSYTFNYKRKISFVLASFTAIVFLITLSIGNSINNINMNVFANSIDAAINANNLEDQSTEIQSNVIIQLSNSSTDEEQNQIDENVDSLQTYIEVFDYYIFNKTNTSSYVFTRIGINRYKVTSPNIDYSITIKKSGYKKYSGEITASDNNYLFTINNTNNQFYLELKNDQTDVSTSISYSNVENDTEVSISTNTGNKENTVLLKKANNKIKMSLKNKSYDFSIVNDADQRTVLLTNFNENDDDSIEFEYFKNNNNVKITVHKNGNTRVLNRQRKIKRNK